MSESNLIATVNGGENILGFNGAELVFQAVILDSDGTPRDLTGETVDAEVQAARTRTDTPAAEWSATLTNAAAGHVTVTVNTATMTLAAGSTFFVWIRVTDVGGEVHYAQASAQLNVQ